MTVRWFVPLVLACLLVGVGVASYLWYEARQARDSGNEPQPPVPASIAPTVPEPVRPAKAAVSRPPRTADPAAGKLTLPDGSEVAALNGVAEPPAMTWGDGPYSPIVGTEYGNGYDWYVHADGTRTTTVELWRQDLGRKDAVTLVYRPGQLAPTDPGR